MKNLLVLVSLLCFSELVRTNDTDDCGSTPTDALVTIFRDMRPTRPIKLCLGFFFKDDQVVAYCPAGIFSKHSITYGQLKQVHVKSKSGKTYEAKSFEAKTESDKYRHQWFTLNIDTNEKNEHICLYPTNLRKSSSVARLSFEPETLKYDFIIDSLRIPDCKSNKTEKAIRIDCLSHARRIDPNNLYLGFAKESDGWHLVSYSYKLEDKKLINDNPNGAFIENELYEIPPNGSLISNDLHKFINDLNKAKLGKLVDSLKDKDLNLGCSIESSDSVANELTLSCKLKL